MSLAFAVLYILCFIELMIVSYKHGKPRENYDIWIALFDKAILLVLIWWITSWRVW